MNNYEWVCDYWNVGAAYLSCEPTGNYKRIFVDGKETQEFEVIVRLQKPRPLYETWKDYVFRRVVWEGVYETRWFDVCMLKCSYTLNSWRSK